MQIICDTDFLMKVANDPVPKLDWKALCVENEFITLPCVVRELKGLSSRPPGKTSRRAKNALRVLESGLIKLISRGGNEEADFALMRFVRTEPSKRLLATLDGSLLSALEKNGLGYFTLSSHKVLIRPAKQQRI